VGRDGFATDTDVVQEQPVQIGLTVQVGHYWVKLYANDEPVAQRAFPILFVVPGT